MSAFYYRPGTGKTITVVEAIRQLLDKNPDVKILACAPSNSAADLIAERLTVLGPSQLFRLNAASREYKTLPSGLRDFSLVNGNNVFAIPSLERMQSFRVIVSTCISGGVPHGLGVKRGHFTHIFVDEAGQCMEPDVMIPIRTMTGPQTNVVIAGDNRQLGPSVRSSVALALGLGKSFLTRIMELEVYNLETHTGITSVDFLTFERQCNSNMTCSSESLSSLKISDLTPQFSSSPTINSTGASSGHAPILSSLTVFFGARWSSRAFHLFSMG